MVLVDTSVWVAHLRQGNVGLEVLLTEGRVLSHPFIVGELACGNLQQRAEILTHMAALPQAVLASHDEVLHFIEAYHLMGWGLGYVDVNLLASARLSGAPLWTLDKRLREAAMKLKLAPYEWIGPQGGPGTQRRV
jgi:predicted nucleic acid-binding protein